MEAKIADSVANLDLQKKSSFGAQIIDKDSKIRKPKEGKAPQYVDFESLLQ